jgi:ADP-ribose pyrophosphatase YjhB (NUDIX family)
VLRSRDGSSTVGRVIPLATSADRAIGIRPSVSPVIFDGRGRRPLQQRSDGGQWGLPGGSAEIGESVEPAVPREVQAETGLEVAVRLPARLRPTHRVRLRDARARRTTAFVR